MVFRHFDRALSTKIVVLPRRLALIDVIKGIKREPDLIAMLLL
jgi:hypothetical protein